MMINVRRFEFSFLAWFIKILSAQKSRYKALMIFFGFFFVQIASVSQICHAFNVDQYLSLAGI